MNRVVLIVAPVLLVIGGCGEDKPTFTEEEMTRIPLPQRSNLPTVSGGFFAVGRQ